MTTILGHAGAATAPPNTLESFQSAIDQQADGTELDVQMTGDGQVVCIHDEHLERLTDGTGLVKDHTYAELSKLNASVSVDGYPRTRIPLLAEVLDLFSKAGLEVNIEIKSGMIIYPGIERAVLDVVSRTVMSEHVCYSSFNHYSLLEVRRLDPHARIAPLYSTGLVNPWDYVASLHAQAVHPFFLNLTAAEQMVPGLDPIEEFHRHDIIVRAWTVDDPATLRWLFEHGVDAVITNEPARARRVLEAINGPGSPTDDKLGTATASSSSPSQTLDKQGASEHVRQR